MDAGHIFKGSEGTKSLLCCLIRYFRKERLLLLEGIRMDSGYAPDAKLGSEVVRGTSLKGFLLADPGFDSLEIFEKAERKGFIPMTPFCITCGLSPRAYLAV